MIVLILCVGIGGGAALVASTSPLGALQREREQKFLYADENCGFSQLAVAYLKQHPESDVLVVPVKYTDSQWANWYCSGALAQLSGMSRFIWYTLAPLDSACGRLTSEAKSWHSLNVPEGQTPVWGEGSRLVGTGFSKENLRLLNLPESEDAH